MPKMPSQPRTLLLAILALALLIRLLGLVSRPIWYDEAFSILFSEKGPAAMLQGTLPASGGSAAEEHPLGYYLILYAWEEVFGNFLPAVRIVSVLAGVTSVGLLYLTGRELFTERIGLAGAILGALSPFQVHYSQEIRMYALLGMWLLLTTYAFLRGARTQSPKWWAVFALGATLAQYTHTLASLYLIPLALTPLFQRDWRTLRAVLVSGFCALLLYLPWLIHIPAQLSKVNSTYWILRPGMEKAFTLLLVYVTNLPLPDGWLFPGLAIAVFLFFIALWQSFRMFARREPGWKAGAWLMYLAFTPPLLSFLLSQWRPVYLERSFLPSGALFCLWLAWAVFATRLPRPVQILTVCGLAIATMMGIGQHLSYTGFPYAPYRELQTSLQNQAQAGDAIIHSSKLSYLPAIYYDSALNQTFIADPPGSDVDTLSSTTQDVLKVTSHPDIQTAARGVRQVWFIIFRQSLEEYASESGQIHPHLAWLEKNFHLVSIEDMGDLRLYHFSR